MKKQKNFYLEFKPELSPKKMLEYGVFGGSYLGDTINEFPESWFKKAKISKSFDVNLNYFQIILMFIIKNVKKYIMNT